MTQPTMRAKLYVTGLVASGEPVVQETLSMTAVSGSKFGPQGESEDNTFARYTPMATLTMTITNPALLGKFAIGQVFYVDFTPAVRGFTYAGTTTSEG